MIVALGAVIAAIWMVALYGTYEDAKKEKYDVGVRPGAVTYGTHSSAVVPMVSSPMHSTSAPMISAGAIRSFAYQGHATMPSTATGSGFKLHTTSSATVHTLGSGGGGSIGTASGSSSSSRGITYGGTSVSMPTFALVTPTYTSSRTTSEIYTPRAMGPRKSPGDGEPGYGYGDTQDDGGIWYMWDGEDWIELSQGDERLYMGVWQTWNASTHSWENKNGDIQENGEDTPVGATPWILMLFLAIGYGIVKVIRKKQNTI